MSLESTHFQLFGSTSSLESVMELSVEVASWLGRADFSVDMLRGGRRRAVSRRREQDKGTKTAEI
jgi:hypothetical protein